MNRIPTRQFAVFALVLVSITLLLSFVQTRRTGAAPAYVGTLSQTIAKPETYSIHLTITGLNGQTPPSSIWSDPDGSQLSQACAPGQTTRQYFYEFGSLYKVIDYFYISACNREPGIYRVTVGASINKTFRITRPTFHSYLPQIVTPLVPPHPFAKLGPAHQATNQKLNLTLDWADTFPVDDYEYCYDASNDGACAAWINAGNASQADIGGLSPNTTYYWQVRAVNLLGVAYADGAASAQFAFTTGSGRPDPFSKSSPADAAAEQPLSLTLDWEDSAGVTSYQYCYDTSDDDACTAWTDTGLSSQTDLSGLAPSTTYYWQARASNAQGSTYAGGASTAFWSFTTASGLPAPFAKLAPADLAASQPLSLTLDWADSADSDSYQFCYDTSNDGACATWTDTGTTSQVNINGLSLNTTYYWQARAGNVHGATYADGDSAAYWSFTTEDGLPGPFAKLSPADGASDLATTLILDWAVSDEAESYEFCYDTSDDDACSSWSSTQITTQVAISGLNTLTTYYWQVRASNVNGDTYADGGAVAHHSFTTGGGVVPGAMILVPAGAFQMGCHPDYVAGFFCEDAELPLHTVYLDAYQIDQVEVTNGRYAQCVTAGDCTAPADTSSVGRESYYGEPAYDDYPVIHVAWQNAADFCAWDGKRLPTEAEWEKAARGASLRTFPWGEQAADCSLLNFDDFVAGVACVGDTAAVGSYPLGASPYGVLDMAGNVAEWVNDWYGADYYDSSPASNPQGPASGTHRVKRGGGFMSLFYDVLISYRSHRTPTTANNDIGFRCAASAP